MICAAGVCEGASNDAPSSWEDEDDDEVTGIPAGDYGAVAWLDHNGNILMGGGPDTGDTVCCVNATVGAGTSSVNLLSGSCQDL